ncbi:MAG: TetR/AcrR family transcriptional regulator [Deinococcota bacterium]
MSHSEAKERVLQAAETLFTERGYEAVVIKDIAKQAGIHHASLYHHIPGGKSALFVEVMMRQMKRHETGLHKVISDYEGDVRKQLEHIAGWFIDHPPVDVIRLTRSDLAAIPEAEAEQVSNMAYQATLIPLISILEAARARGELALKKTSTGNIAGALFSAFQGLHAIPEAHLARSRQVMANEIIDVVLRGLVKD